MIKIDEIRNRKFRKVIRGCDPVEIKYFLEMLADEFAQMGEKMEKMEALIAEFDHTRKGRDKILKEARDQAAGIIIEAESIASEMVANAEIRKLQIQDTIDKLILKREKLFQRLHNAIVNQTELLALLENTQDWSDEEIDNHESPNGKI